MQSEAERIAAGLSEAQRKALIAFPPDEPFHTAMQGDVMLRPCRTAGELGVSGNTLTSMWGLGGVDAKTLELGPLLCSAEWGERGKRYWQLSNLGLAVREVLMRPPVR